MRNVKLLCRTPPDAAPGINHFTRRRLAGNRRRQHQKGMSAIRWYWRLAGVGRWTAVALLLQLAAAHAHPHNRILVDAAILVRDSAIEGIRYVWQFDRTYADGLKEEYDSDRDGVLSDNELQAWLAASKTNLETFKFFTTIHRGREILPLGAADDYRVERTADGLALHFTVHLVAPASLEPGPIGIDVYDRTFFTEFVLGDGHGIIVEGAAPGACSATVALAPGGDQQKAINAFMKMFGRIDAKLAPAKAITVSCKD